MTDTRKAMTDEEIKKEKPLLADFVSFRAGVRCAERLYQARIAELEAALAQQGEQPVAVVDSELPGGIGWTAAGRDLVDGQELYAGAAPAAQPVQVDSRVLECARRLVEHADFKLGGILSADSKAKDIPSRAVSQVKSRHLAALRDAIAAAPAAQQDKQEASEFHIALIRELADTKQSLLATENQLATSKKMLAQALKDAWNESAAPAAQPVQGETYTRVETPKKLDTFDKLYSHEDILRLQQDTMRASDAFCARQKARMKQQDDISQLLKEREYRDEIINKLCDAVLGTDRYEWSSMYFFEDAVREVEERMYTLTRGEPIWYHAECTDPDYSRFTQDKAEAHAIVSDKGGCVTELFAATPSTPQPDARKVIEQMVGALEDRIGCFEAAEGEGLSDVLAETTDERLKDLVERRLTWAPELMAAAIQAGQKWMEENK